VRHEQEVEIREPHPSSTISNQNLNTNQFSQTSTANTRHPSPKAYKPVSPRLANPFLALCNLPEASCESISIDCNDAEQCISAEHNIIAEPVLGSPKVIKPKETDWQSTQTAKLISDALGVGLRKKKRKPRFQPLPTMQEGHQEGNMGDDSTSSSCSSPRVRESEVTMSVHPISPGCHVMSIQQGKVPSLMPLGAGTYTTSGSTPPAQVKGQGGLGNEFELYHMPGSSSVVGVELAPPAQEKPIMLSQCQLNVPDSIQIVPN